MWYRKQGLKIRVDRSDFTKRIEPQLIESSFLKRVLGNNVDCMVDHKVSLQTSISTINMQTKCPRIPFHKENLHFLLDSITQDWKKTCWGWSCLLARVGLPERRVWPSESNKYSMSI